MKLDLAHDFLAIEIYNQASPDLRKRKELLYFFQNQYKQYKKRGKLLDQDDLQEIKPFVFKLRLNPEEYQFIQQSEEAIRKTARRKKLTIISVMIILAISAMIASMMAIKAHLNEQIAVTQSRISHANQLTAYSVLEYKKNGNATKAVRLALYALHQHDSEQGRQALYDAYYQGEASHANPLFINFADNGQKENKVSLSPDGIKVLSISEDKSLIIWDIKGNALANFNLNQEKVRDACFSPNANQVAGVLTNGTAKVWGLSGRELFVINGHSKKLNTISYSPDGEIIATGSNDHTIRLWDKEGRLLKVLADHTGPVNFIRFSPDGNKLLSTSDSTAEAMLWNSRIKAGTKSLIASLPGHSDYISFSFSPNGKYFCTSSDAKINIWSARGKLLKTFYNPSSYNLTGIAFSPNKDLLATVSGDSLCRIWNLEGVQKQTISGHQDRIYQVDWTEDNLIVTASKDHTAKIWTLEGKLVADLVGHQAPLNDLSVALKDQLIITASEDQSIKAWPLNPPYSLLSGHESPVTSCLFLDSASFLTGSRDGIVNWWTARGQLKATFETRERSGVVSMAISKNGKIGIALENGTIEVWELDKESFQLVRRPYFSELSERINSLAFSLHDNHILIAESQNITVLTEEGEFIQRIGPLPGEARQVIYSPKGNLIVIITFDKDAFFYTKDGAPLTQMEGITQIVFSHDGSRLATLNDDQVARIWKITPESPSVFQLINTIDIQEYTRTFDFSPDGKYILVKSSSSTLKIWSTSGRRIARLNHPEKLFTACFSPNARYILTTSLKGDAYLWPFSPQQITRNLDETGIADLSNEEKQLYGLEQNK